MLRHPTIALLIAVLALNRAAGAQQELALGTVAGAPGSMVVVPITFDGDDTAVAIQLDVSFDATILTADAVTADSALSDHQLAWSSPSPGLLRMVVYSPVNAALGDGSLAELDFTIAAEAPPGTTPLDLSGVVLSNALAGASNSGLTSGHVEVVPGNIAPIADAGPDQTVETGTVVILDGGNSSDADGDLPLTYDWQIITTPPASTAVLSDRSAVTPTFVADAEGGYEIELIVTDSRGLASVADNITVQAVTGPPTLLVPSPVRTIVGETAAVPVELSTQGHALGATDFSIDYDQSCLLFDSTDADFDGIPDAVAFALPVGFIPSATVDSNDSDGEIDIAVMPDGATLLADGVLATLTFGAGCAPPPGGSLLAPVSFSGDPQATFSDPQNGNVPGLTVDGGVEIYPDLRGDCNGNGLLDVADLVAGRLEIFDGDEPLWLASPDGTFAGNPAGCDANADTVIDVGDLSCTNRLIFGLTCSGESATGFKAVTAPRLSIPYELPIVDGHKVIVTVVLEPGEHAVNSVAFSLDIDQTVLKLDAKDPEAVRFLGAPVSMRSVRVDLDDATGELDFVIADLTTDPDLLYPGPLVEVELWLRDPEKPRDTVRWAVGFADHPAASFGSIDGTSIQGSAWISTPSLFIDSFESGDTSTWPPSPP